MNTYSNLIEILQERGLSEKHVKLLVKLAALQGEVLSGKEPIKGSKPGGCDPDVFVNEPHMLHGLVRGIYVPKNDNFALSIQLTEKHENYGKEITYFSPSEWRIEYRPPTDKRPSDGRAVSDTMALKRCMDQGIPVGILRNKGTGVNEILGLGKIIAIEGGSFSIVPFELEDIIASELESAVDRYIDGKIKAGDYSAPDAEATVLARRGQNRFRQKLIAVYGGSCAFCSFDAEEYLIASHIMPWAKDKKNRLNPRNGILLCRMCDCAFESGDLRLISGLEIQISPRLSARKNNASVGSWLSNIGPRIRIKEAEYMPDESLLRKRDQLQSP